MDGVISSTSDPAAKADFLYDHWRKTFTAKDINSEQADSFLARWGPRLPEAHFMFPSVAAVARCIG